MVDFNNEATIGTPAIDIVRVSILQRRYDLFEAFEDYKKKRFSGSGVTLSVVRARLISFFCDLQAMLKRRLKEEDYEEIVTTIFNSNKEEEILNIILRLNEELDTIRLTRVDTQRVYDRTIVEKENKEKGF